MQQPNLEQDISEASSVDSVTAFWVSQIETYEQQFQKWEARSKKIIKRYKDERDQKRGARFNILWSNIQTLSPALYASPPKPNVDRRFQDDDDLGRYASLTLERAVSYYVGHAIFNDTMKQAVLDRLLGGRGTTWIRYVPVFETADSAAPVETGQVTDDEPDQYLKSEDVIPDYVHWQDFGHTWARTWQEVRAVWRIVYMGRPQLIKRFGERGKTIPLDAKPMGKDDNNLSELVKKATVYEIWDKETQKAIWIHKTVAEPLDEKPDPLKLNDFFPCPKPIYATLTNDDLIPTPDFILYQDQAIELDMLTSRIEKITKAIKVAGVYDASAEGVDRLLSEGVENKLIPVEQWAVLGEKGGLKGVMDLLPMVDIVRTLQALYEARDKVKQVIYEITGIADIVRGATNPNETAAAQKIKGQYATLRLDDNQKDIARFSCDMVKIMTEIIAEHFSMDTIKQVSGIKLLTGQEKQQIKQMMAQSQGMPQQPGQPPAAPPIPDETLELMEMPSWEQVEQLIRNDTARCFRIDIETDSTIKTDQDAEKQSRMEFLNAAGAFIQQAVQVPNPELQPLLMEMLMFGVRGFKVTRELETTFETTLNKLKKQADNPPQQPGIEIEKIKGEQQQRQIQADGVKMQNDNAISQREFEIRNKQLDVEETKSHHELAKTKIDAKTKVSPDVAMTDPELNNGQSPLLQLGQMFAQGFAQIAQGQQQNAQAMLQSNERVIQAITAPKVLVKDAAGKTMGVKTV